MSFPAWLKRQTGLTLHDFRVLDTDGKCERWVHNLFHKWQGAVNPTAEQIAEAIESIKEEF